MKVVDSMPLTVGLRRAIGELLPEPQRKAVAAVRNLLVKQGLYRTMSTGRPVRPDDSPLPWFTYAAIGYLEQLDLASASIFEYGSGNSTLWWQDRVKFVRSVEHDPEWHDHLRAKVGPNVDYRLTADPDAYVNALEGDFYDIIVIDGEHRPRCVPQAIEHLRPGGFVVFDNADWFPTCAEELRRADLIEVDFAGFGPINAYTSVTSLFLHPDFRPVAASAMPRVPSGGMTGNVTNGICP
jgi:hypothetical protein